MNPVNGKSELAKIIKYLPVKFLYTHSSLKQRQTKNKLLKNKDTAGCGNEKDPIRPT